MTPTQLERNNGLTTKNSSLNGPIMGSLYFCHQNPISRPRRHLFHSLLRPTPSLPIFPGTLILGSVSRTLEVFSWKFFTVDQFSSFNPLESGTNCSLHFSLVLIGFNCSMFRLCNDTSFEAPNQMLQNKKCKTSSK